MYSGYFGQDYGTSHPTGQILPSGGDGMVAEEGSTTHATAPYRQTPTEQGGDNNQPSWCLCFNC